MASNTYWPILNIPAAKEGEYAIQHMTYPAGYKFSTASTRAAMFGEQKIVAVHFDRPVRYHKLTGPTGTWMTDLPIEQCQANRVFRHYCGDVLVGGLGLGYAAVRIAEKKRVREVVVVEVSPEVIALVEPHLPEHVRNKIRVVCDELFAYLNACVALKVRKYDRAFYDIWQSDGECTFHEIVVPLLSASRHVVRKRADCWNEDVMRGQLTLNLTMMFTQMIHVPWHLPTLDELCLPRSNILWDWRVPFFQWLRAEKLNKAKDVARVGHMASLYTSLYGVPGWEQRWQTATAIL